MTSSTKRQAAKRSTHEREVGPCPGCKQPVTAELDVATFLGDVTMDDQGQPQRSSEQHPPEKEKQIKKNKKEQQAHQAPDTAVSPIYTHGLHPFKNSW